MSASDHTINVFFKHVNPMISGARNLLKDKWRKGIHESKMLTSY